MIGCGSECVLCVYCSHGAVNWMLWCAGECPATQTVVWQRYGLLLVFTRCEHFWIVTPQANTERWRVCWTTCEPVVKVQMFKSGVHSYWSCMPWRFRCTRLAKTRRNWDLFTRYLSKAGTIELCATARNPSYIVQFRRKLFWSSQPSLTLWTWGSFMSAAAKCTWGIEAGWTQVFVSSMRLRYMTMGTGRVNA